VAKQVQVFGYVQNIFDQRYYTAGALGPTGEFMTGPSITNPQAFGPGRPVAIFGGVRITL
jgi:iron complex outermembrane receptor protein